MRSIVKKIATLMVAIAMFFMGNTTPVFASEVSPDGSKCSITICVYDISAAKKEGVETNTLEAATGADKAPKDMGDYALAGVKFSYLKVADSFFQTKSADNIELYFQIDKELAQIMRAGSPTSIEIADNQVKDCYTSNQLNKAMASADYEVKKAVENYIKEKKGIVMGETDTKGQTKVTGLEPGLYLIVESEVPDQVRETSIPFFIQLPMTNATGDGWLYDVCAYPKNQTDFPVLEKRVKNLTTGGDYEDAASASIGDTLGYRITTNLPAITTPATYLAQYSISDVAEQVLISSEDLTVFISSSKTIQLEKADYEVAISENQLSFALNASGLAKLNEAGGKSLTLEYTGKLTATPILGDKGMLNTASLTYRRTNASYAETTGDGAKVYSYGIKITKSHKETEEKGDTSLTDTKEQERNKIRDQIHKLEDQIEELKDAVNTEAADETAAEKRERERKIRDLERQIENLEYNEDMLERAAVSTAKEDDEKEFDFSKVKFSLKNEDTGKYYAITDNGGIYSVTGLSDTPTEFTVSSSGIADVVGIGAGKYTLTETQTSDGYALPEKATTIKISATEDNITGFALSYTKSDVGNTVSAGQNTVSVSNKHGASATVNDAKAEMLASNGSANAIVSVSVENLSEELVAQQKNEEALEELVKTGVLPQTGEYGIYYMTLLGIGVGIFGCFMLFLSKKRRK